MTHFQDQLAAIRGDSNDDEENGCYIRNTFCSCNRCVYHIISNQRCVFQLGICKTPQRNELVYKADIHYTYSIICF